MFNLKPPPGFISHPEYVKKLRSAMPEAYKVASETAQRKLREGRSSMTRKCAETHQLVRKKRDLFGICACSAYACIIVGIFSREF